MKNQTELIISIVAFVFAVIIGIALFATQRQPVAPEAAPTAELTPVKLPDSASMVQYASSLPGGGNNGSGGFGGAAGMGGMMGGKRGGPPGLMGAAGAGGMGGGRRGPMMGGG